MRPILLLVLMAGQIALMAQVPAGVPDASSLVLHGVVLSQEDSPQPLRGARVTITQDGRIGEPVFSDERGRFEIRVAATGRSTLLVAKAAYAPQAFDLEGPSSGPLEIRMPRGAVLTGRVLDPAGDPLVAAAVLAQRLAVSGADPLVGPQEFAAETDDRGEYRIGSLPAGVYEVRVEQASCQTVQYGNAVAVVPCEPPFAREALPRVEPVIVPLAAGSERFTELAAADASGVAPVSSASPAASVADGAVIAGRIMASGGVAIPNARVTITRDGRPSATAWSDSNGRYVSSGLAPGTYRILAAKAGFHEGEHGRDDVRARIGRSVVLAHDTTRADVDVVLVRGSVIAGTVRDVYGEPLEGITVQAWERRFSEGRPTAVPIIGGARFQQTDDRGHYRIHGLHPGVYYVMAVDESRMPAPVDGDPQRDAPTTALGAAGARSIAMRNLAHVFYPGRPSVVDASAVRVAAGLDAFGVDFVFEPVPGARVSGQIVDAAGQPLRVPVDLLLISRPALGAPALTPRTAVVGPDGRFAFPNVPPGEYVIRAQIHEFTARGAAVPERAAAFGAEAVTVAAHDLGPIVVRTSSGARVDGRIVLAGGDAGVTPAAFDLVAEGIADLANPTARARIDADWRFTARGVTGLVRFVLRRAPPGWWLQSVTIDGINAAEQAVFIAPDGPAREDVLVVLAPSAAEVTGRAVDERASPVGGAAVIVFPTDPSRWDRPRDVRFVRTQADGAFTIGGLAPGEYWVSAAVGLDEALASGELWTPTMLGTLVAGSRRVTLGEYARPSLDLRVLRMR